MPDEIFFNVIISNLLTPFDLAQPVLAVLPIRKNNRYQWEPLTEDEIASMGSSVKMVFAQMCRALGPNKRIVDLWNLINTRNKLVQQQIKPEGYLLISGTSGEIVCSAFIEATNIRTDRLVIDQTVNWTQIKTLDECFYLTGLLSSEAINDVIREFQPEGRFGKRHIHSLPYRATPPFDPSQELHLDVVRNTRKLIYEYLDAKIADSKIQVTLNPNISSLAHRRIVIRNKLRTLPSYKDYNIACRNLYGV